jgi:hypothetical protein
LFPGLFKKVHWEKLVFGIQGSSTSFANTFGYLKLCISSLSFIWLLPSQDHHAIPFSCNVFMDDIFGVSVLWVFAPYIIILFFEVLLDSGHD